MALALCAAFLFHVPPPAKADQADFPALYDVVGVAGDDVLNVRIAPQGTAAIIATLRPDATGIEVVTEDTKGVWGQINVGEVSGWASLRFLKRQPGQSPGNIAAIAQCGGTEPFWHLRRDGVGFVFGGLGLPETRFRLLWTEGSIGHIGRHAMILQRDDGQNATAIITRNACSDGMSEQQFGLTIDLVLSANAASAYYSGCCRLTP